MPLTADIWVFPATGRQAEEISRTGLGLLTEARSIAGKVNGRVTAVLFQDNAAAFSSVLGQYGVDRAMVFKHPLLKNGSAEILALPAAEKIKQERPWLVLLGNTAPEREMAARLAILTGSGVVNNCVKIDLSQPDRPLFYRPASGAQAWEEIVFRPGSTMLVGMDPAVLNCSPSERRSEVTPCIIQPDLAGLNKRLEHQAFLPADFRTVDVAEAATIVSAGMGAINSDLLPLVKELAELIEGSIGATRPVVDEGIIERERMIGQTGKVISPEMYIALGISGASHHLGGIQEAGSIVSINHDPAAPIFQNSDLGIVADLKQVLPGLIEKIRQAKKDGKIL